MYKKVAVIAIALIVMVMPFAVMPGQAAEEDTYTIGISVPAEADYEGLVEGVNAAAEELEIEVQVLFAEDELETEAANIETFIEDGVDAILINPVDAEESTEAIEAAIASEIPVFVIGAEYEDVVTSFMVDDVAAGETAANMICDELEGEESLVLTFESVSDLTAERNEGFTAYMEENCEDAELLAVDISELEETEDVIEAISTVLQENEVDAVFAFDGDTTAATVSAFVSTYSRNISLIGFDANEDTLAAVQMGLASSIISQSEYEIGFVGVETIVNYLAEETEFKDNVTVDAIVIDGDSDMSKCGPWGCGR